MANALLASDWKMPGDSKGPVDAAMPVHSNGMEHARMQFSPSSTSCGANIMAFC